MFLLAPKVMITECVGARNFAAMAVPTCASWRRSLMRTKTALPSHRRFISLKVRASGASSESCLAVKEDFADEEDFIKAGGSELLFVQMQQNKEMDKQSKLADKLPPISVGENVLDLVVIGCGPAGLALAAESAKLGLNVGLIGPDLPFTNNYGVWEDEFKDLGLERCIEHVWRDTIVYLDDDKPIMIGRAYGRVSRHLLHEELLRRCVDSGVMYLNSKVETIIEDTDGNNLVACEHNCVVPCRLVTVASGAASGKLLQYEVGGPRVSVQTAYGIEVEVENNPYDPSLMVFMDYRDYAKQQVPTLEARYPTFLYAMPMSSTKVFFEETCLASKDAMPFDLLKKKLMSRLETMGIRILKVYEESKGTLNFNIPPSNLLVGNQRKQLITNNTTSKGTLNFYTRHLFKFSQCMLSFLVHGQKVPSISIFHPHQIQDSSFYHDSTLFAIELVFRHNSGQWLRSAKLTARNPALWN